MEGYHRSVLLKEAIEALGIKSGKWYLDLTLGDGGHTLGILKLGGNVVGIDADPEALERTRGRLREFGKSGRFVLIRGNFRDIKNLIKQTEAVDQKFEGAIFDLGVSSLQLGSPGRGFSFAKIGPLDMRMDQGLNVRAFDLLNNLSRKELYELFRDLGEEKYSWAVAHALVRAREVRPIENTLELSGIIERIVGRKVKIHPATKVFQALRIAVNDELGALQEGLAEAGDLLEKNGRITVISYHSLEDRIVKNTFKDWQFKGAGRVLTKKPVIPSETEVKDNPRSRSAKMRVFEKNDYHFKI